MGPGVTSEGGRQLSADRRNALLSLVRVSVVDTAIVAGYFLLPMKHFDGRSVLTFTLMVLGLTVLIGWQIREITRSTYPRVRGVEALTTSLTAFFVVFSTTYYSMSSAHPEDFSESLTRLDAAYFTVTIFATVGFGDITAVSEPARAVATTQMLADLVLIGVVARMVVNAIQVGLERRDRPS